VLAAATLAMRQSLAVRREDWCKVAVAGLLNCAAFNILAAFAQMSLTASRAAILTYTMPLWSVLFARLALAEPIDSLRGMALGLGAAGIALLAHPFWDVIASGSIPPGLAYVLGGAIAWAAGTVYMKRAKPVGDPLGLTTWQFAVGALACALGMLAFEAPRLELWRPEIAATLAYNIVFPQAAAYALWFTLMERVTASTAALGTLLVPVFAVIASSLLLGEQLDALDIAGFAMVLAAVGLDQGLRGLMARLAAGPG
jgi:drug/metabolite transporter (DMT)-like permease